MDEQKLRKTLARARTLLIEAADFISDQDYAGNTEEDAINLAIEIDRFVERVERVLYPDAKEEGDG